MKKILATAVAGVVILLGITSVVYASEVEPSLTDDVEYSDEEYELYEETELNEEIELDEEIEQPEIDQQPYRPRQPQSDACLKKKFKTRFRGIWGYLDDNETKGYIRGVVGRRGRVGFLKGVWKTVDNESTGRVVGIMKHGYFNGKVIFQNGDKKPITGFYLINREKHVFHIRWMMPDKSGWMHARYGPVNDTATESADI